MDNNNRKDIENGEIGKKPDKSDLFTDKVVIDDTMEIFDLDSHRRQRENAPSFQNKSGLRDPASSGTPAERKTVPSNPAKPIRREQAKPVQNTVAKPVQPSNAQNAKHQQNDKTKPAQPTSGVRTTPPAMPRRMRVISSEVSQSEIFTTPVQPVREFGKDHPRPVKPQSSDELFEKVYGKESSSDVYQKKKAFIRRGSGDGGIRCDIFFKKQKVRFGS